MTINRTLADLPTSTTYDVNGKEIILDADGDTSITADSDDQIDFKIGGSDAVTIASGGDVTVSTGNLVIGTSGKGIDFSATADGTTMSSELFDDYEEGQYTPTLTTHTSGGYNLNSGYDLLTYTKIGRTVHVFGRIDVASDNSPSGQLQLSLPFTSVNLTEYSDTGYFPCVVFSGHADSDANADIVGWIESSVSSLKFYEVVRGTGAASYLLESEVDAAFGINLNLTYIAA